MNKLIRSEAVTSLVQEVIDGDFEDMIPDPRAELNRMCLVGSIQHTHNEETAGLLELAFNAATVATLPHVFMTENHEGDTDIYYFFEAESEEALLGLLRMNLNLE